eukprot:7196-Hanusia_phi.AAC.5
MLGQLGPNRWVVLALARLHDVMPEDAVENAATRGNDMLKKEEGRRRRRSVFAATSLFGAPPPHLHVDHVTVGLELELHAEDQQEDDEPSPPPLLTNFVSSPRKSASWCECLDGISRSLPACQGRRLEQAGKQASNLPAATTTHRPARFCPILRSLRLLT